MQQTVDISGILAAKARRRQALAALSWEEKVAIVERMRVLLPQGQWKRKGPADDEQADQTASSIECAKPREAGRAENPRRAGADAGG
jgi:hypothetical protein